MRARLELTPIACSYCIRFFSVSQPVEHFICDSQRAEHLSTSLNKAYAICDNEKRTDGTRTCVPGYFVLGVTLEPEVDDSCFELPGDPVQARLLGSAASGSSHAKKEFCMEITKFCTSQKSFDDLSARAITSTCKVIATIGAFNVLWS